MNCVTSKMFPTSPKLWSLLKVLTEGGKKGVVVGEKCWWKWGGRREGGCRWGGWKKRGEGRRMWEGQPGSKWWKVRRGMESKGMGKERGICARLAASSSQRRRVGETANAGEREAEPPWREGTGKLRLKTLLLDRLLCLVTVVLEPDLDLGKLLFNGKKRWHLRLKSKPD